MRIQPQIHKINEGGGAAVIASQFGTGETDPHATSWRTPQNPGPVRSREASWGDAGGAAGRSGADGSVFSEGREASGGGCGFANCPLAVPRPDPGRRALAGHSPSEPRGGGAFLPPPAWAARAALVYAARCGFLPPPSRGRPPVFPHALPSVCASAPEFLLFVRTPVLSG